MQKMATQKLKDFLAALIYYKDRYRRFPAFLRQIGLLDKNVFNRSLSDMVIMILRRVFGETHDNLQAVGDRLSGAKGSGETLVPENLIPGCIIGTKADLKDSKLKTGRRC